MLATPLFLSSNLVFGRMVIPEVSPFILAFLRWSAVSFVMLPFMAGNFGSLARLAGQQWPRLLALGFLGMFICGGVVYAALRHTTATNSTLIYTTSPVIIILIEAAFFGRRIGVREALGSAIAFLGVAVIVFRGDLGVLFALDFNLGDLLFVLSAVAWAVYSILYRSPRLALVSTPSLLGIVAAAGALTILPFAAWEFVTGDAMPVTISAWTSIAGIVVVSSLLAFSGFQYGVRALGPSLAGLFMYLLPPYGVLLAVIVLGERFEPFHLAGIALVLGGIVLATFPAAWLRERYGR